MLYKSENVYPILTGLFWSSYYYEGGGLICPHPLKMRVMSGRFRN